MLLNVTHQQLFDNLNVLVKEHQPVFCSKDVSFENTLYRIFDYNLANYQSFLLPSSLESRGIMFEVDSEGNMIELVSLPMQKFFNYKENPYTEGLEKEFMSVVMDKQDGSLMSSYLRNGNVYLKSKGALFSEQAISANKVLEKLPLLKQAILEFELQGYTVNLEYTAPDNQIVLKYDSANLSVLNARSRKTGEYVDFELIKSNFPVENTVDFITQYSHLTLEDFSKIVYDMRDIEGFVLQTKSGQWVKLKTNWYCERHNSVNKFSPYFKKGRRELIMAVFEQRTDDVRQLLIDNDFMLDVISKVEQFVVDYLEEIEKETKEFAAKYSDLKGHELFKMAQKQFSNNPIKLNVALGLSRGLPVCIESQLKKAAHASSLLDYNNLFNFLGEEP